MLFAERKLKDAGQNIKQLIAEADQNTPNRQGVIDTLLDKHFGSLDKPNLDLMPSTPAQEKGTILKLLKREIMNQGKGSLGNTSFSDLQNWKSGAGAQGAFDKNTTSATNKLFQNISRKYGQVLREAIPGIGEEYDTYAKAKQTISAQGAGILNTLSHHYNQLPFFARYMVARQLYSSLDNVKNIKDLITPQYTQGMQNSLGGSFQGFGNYS